MKILIQSYEDCSSNTAITLRGKYSFGFGASINEAIEQDRVNNITHAPETIAASGWGGWGGSVSDGNGDALGGGSSSDFDSGSGYSDWGGHEEQNDGWGE